MAQAWRCRVLTDRSSEHELTAYRPNRKSDKVFIDFRSIDRAEIRTVRTAPVKAQLEFPGWPPVPPLFWQTDKKADRWRYVRESNTSTPVWAGYFSSRVGFRLVEEAACQN